MKALIKKARQIKFDLALAEKIGWDMQDLTIGGYMGSHLIGQKMAYFAISSAAAEHGLARQVFSSVEMQFADVLDEAKPPWKQTAEQLLERIGACSSYIQIAVHQKKCNELLERSVLTTDEQVFYSALGDCLEAVSLRRPRAAKGWDNPKPCSLCWRIAPEGRGRRWLCAKHVGPYQHAARKKQQRVLDHFKSTVGQLNPGEIWKRERAIQRTLRENELFQAEKLNADQFKLVHELMPLAINGHPDVESAAKALDPEGYPWHIKIMGRYAARDGASLYFLARAQAWLSAEFDRKQAAEAGRKKPRGKRK